MFRPVTAFDSNGENKAIQLGLFRTPTNEVLDKLRQIDINRLSPLEALNQLDQLRKEVTDLNRE